MHYWKKTHYRNLGIDGQCIFDVITTPQVEFVFAFNLILDYYDAEILTEQETNYLLEIAELFQALKDINDKNRQLRETDD